MPNNVTSTTSFRAKHHNNVHIPVFQGNALFPLTHVFNRMSSENGWDRGVLSRTKQFIVMASNLAPALSLNEGIDVIGRSAGWSHILDFIKPIAAIFTRQLTIDGINKANLYKPIAASISAVGLLSAKKLFAMPRYLLRPVLAVFLYAIEEFDSLKSIIGANKDTHKCNHEGCSHSHNDDVEHAEKKQKQEAHIDEHKPTWSKLLTGLGIIEIQLNTVAPLVNKLSDHALGPDPEGFIGGLKKVAFNTLALSFGFVSLGEIIKQGAIFLGNSSNVESIQKLIGSIEASVCPCCGVSGTCASTVAEDVMATGGVAL